MKKDKTILKTGRIQQLILDSSPLAIIAVDESFRVILWNPAAEKMFGWREEEVVGHLLPTIPEAEREKFLELNRAADRGYETVIERARRLKKDGSIIDVSISLSPVRGARGQVIGRVGIVADVTEHVKIERALRESEETAWALLNATHDAAALLDADGTILLLNNTLAARLKGTLDELTGKCAYDILAPELATKGRVLIDEVFRSGKPGRIEYERDGIWSDDHIHPVFDPEGKVRRVAIFAQDITDRKRSEEILREREKQFRTVVENSPVAMCVISRVSRKIVMLNRKFKALFGYTEKDLPDEARWWSLAYPDEEYREKAKAIWEKGVEKTDREHLAHRPMEARVVCKNGSFRDIEFYYSSIGDLYMVSFIDLTERKKDVRALRENRRELQSQNRELAETRSFLQHILDSSTEGVTTTDLDGNVLFQNRRINELLGYREAEVVGHKVYQHYANGIEDARAIMTGLREKGELKNHEMRLKKRTGELVDIMLSVSYLKNEREEIIGTIGVYMDVTEHRKLEVQLLQAQKMEAIGTLAGGIAHNFNNLLTGIQGHASLMLLDTDADHPSYQRLKSIEDQVKSGAGLTMQLLGFARGGKYQIRPTDMNEVIEKTSDLFGRTKKEITIHGDYGEGLWPVEVDRGQMEQVFLNLYVNAWQAMPAGGDIFLETRNVVLDEFNSKPMDVKPGNYVYISVTDNGVGMDEKTKSRIFEPFFTTKEMGRGTGLGLATVYGIIKGHKGCINVYSEKGNGTTFKIYLPVSAKASPREKKFFEKPVRGSGTVLIVDDEETILEVTKDLLERLGYEALTAKSGDEAIGIYRAGKDRIDLAILDMVMPGMSGGEVLERLKEIEPDVKVILSSGYNLSGQAASILEEGCKAFIQKPFGLNDLSRKIREVLDGV